MLDFLFGRHMLASRFSILRTFLILSLSVNFEHIKVIINSSLLLMFILNRFVALFLNLPSSLFLNPLFFKSQKEKSYTLQKFYAFYAVFWSNFSKLLTIALGRLLIIPFCQELQSYLAQRQNNFGPRAMAVNIFFLQRIIDSM